MTEVTWGIVLFAALMSIYTLGWIAGHEHCGRLWEKKILDDDDEFENLKEKHDG